MAHRRIFEPVIDQHETWIAVNPVQGCPKACEYCYLNGRGKTLVKPQALTTPDETLKLLLANPYYRSSAVLALYTCTDVLATVPNRRHLIRLLDHLGQSAVRNPICLITKCAITPDVLDCINRNRVAGLTILIYLSYSGLGPDVEHGIDHNALRRNFPMLREHNVPIIHYWRPLIPRNTSPRIIGNVLTWVSQYALCSVTVGLKVPAGEASRVRRIWPALAVSDLAAESAESLWPAGAWETIQESARTNPSYRIFRANSCALRYALHTSNQTISTDTPATTITCPGRIRAACGTCAHASQPNVREDDISRHLRRLGLPRLSYSWNPADRVITISGQMALRDRNNLTHALQVKVRTTENSNDTYWTGQFSDHQPLILEG